MGMISGWTQRWSFDRQSGPETRVGEGLRCCKRHRLVAEQRKEGAGTDGRPQTALAYTAPFSSIFSMARPCPTMMTTSL